MPTLILDAPLFVLGSPARGNPNSVRPSRTPQLKSAPPLSEVGRPSSRRLVCEVAPSSAVSSHRPAPKRSLDQFTLTRIPACRQCRPLRASAAMRHCRNCWVSLRSSRCWRAQRVAAAASWFDDLRLSSREINRARAAPFNCRIATPRASTAMPATSKASSRTQTARGALLALRAELTTRGSRRREAATLAGARVDSTVSSALASSLAAHAQSIFVACLS